jgi:hypothetical protein
MRTICVKPDGKIYRLTMTVNGTDENMKDIVKGPVGYSIVDVRHKLARGGIGGYMSDMFKVNHSGNQLYQLNKISFF